MNTLADELNASIETERLVLRRLVLADAPALFRTVGDPAVMQFWAPGPDASIAETQRRITAIEDHWQAHGFGDWAVVEKASGNLIGFSGLHYITDMAEVNIGYALEQSKWGKGFGYETCLAVLDAGFWRFGLREIVAVIAPENRASISLAQKCGLRLWKAVVWQGRDRVVHHLLREEYAMR